MWLVAYRSGRVPRFDGSFRVEAVRSNNAALASVKNSFMLAMQSERSTEGLIVPSYRDSRWEGGTRSSANPAFGFASATNAIPLPDSEPRAMREHVGVPAIRSREIAQAQRSRVRHFVDSLKVFDFGDGSVNVHAAQFGYAATSILEFASPLCCAGTSCLLR